MTKYFNAAAIISIVLFTSCGSSNGPDVDKSIMPDSAKTTTVSPAGVDVATSPITPVQTVVSPTDAKTMPAPAPAPAASGAGLNPAHGQPGHRCDIAVGAPLNSAPAQKTPAASTPPVVTSAPVTTPVTTAPPTVTAPGMNPPHGQPGHDCSIAVGAPLKKG